MNDPRELEREEIDPAEADDATVAAVMESIRPLRAQFEEVREAREKRRAAFLASKAK